MEEKKLTIEDCLIDWDHYETKDEKGNPVVIAVSKEQQDEWLHEDCDCNEINKADRAKCTAYYTFNYKREKLDAYYESIGKTSYVANYPIWGLIAMVGSNRRHTWIGQICICLSAAVVCPISFTA